MIMKTSERSWLIAELEIRAMQVRVGSGLTDTDITMEEQRGRS